LRFFIHEQVSFEEYLGELDSVGQGADGVQAAASAAA
jgi:hypothetical protein